MVGEHNREYELKTMDQPAITFILNEKTYSLRATDSHAIRQIPSGDRQQLISLLEAVKQQDALAHQAVDQAVTRATSGYQASNGSMAAADPSAPPPANPERLGSGDVDALMARLVMEEKLSQKPGLTRQGIYKFLAWSAAVIVLLVIVF